MKLCSARKAFTLIEVLVVIAILAIFTGLAVATVLSSWQDSKVANARGDAKTLNDALYRIKIKDWEDMGPGTVAVTGGSDLAADKQAAMEYYYQNNYIKERVDLTYIKFVGGEWRIDLP